MLTLAIGVVLLALAVIGLAGLSFWVGGRAERERQRGASELRLAQWRMRQVTQMAMRRMLEEARRGHGRIE